jgi:hypothetical protein
MRDFPKQHGIGEYGHRINKPSSLFEVLQSKRSCGQSGNEKQVILLNEAFGSSTKIKGQGNVGGCRRLGLFLFSQP